VLRTRVVDVSLWEVELPAEVLRLEKLARVDVLLDDPVFFAPFVQFFDPRVGRPSTPMEVCPPDDVPEVPLPARVRELVRGGQ